MAVKNFNANYKLGTDTESESQAEIWRGCGQGESRNLSVIAVTNSQPRGIMQ